MKLIELKCNRCGAQLEVNSELKQYTCQYCGNSILIDDEVQHIQYDNMDRSGYDFEMGRLKAQEDFKNEQVRRQQKEIARQKEEAEKKKQEEEQRKREKQERLEAEQREAEEQRKREWEASKPVRRKICALIISFIIIGIIVYYAKGWVKSWIDEIESKKREKRIEETNAAVDFCWEIYKFCDCDEMRDNVNYAPEFWVGEGEIKEGNWVCVSVPDARLCFVLGENYVDANYRSLNGWSDFFYSIDPYQGKGKNDRFVYPVAYEWPYSENSKKAGKVVIEKKEGNYYFDFSDVKGINIKGSHTPDVSAKDRIMAYFACMDAEKESNGMINCTFDVDKGILNVSGTGEIPEDSCQGMLWWLQDDVKSIEIEQGITSLFALYHCQNVEEIILPASIERIPYYAFRGCEELKKIYFGGSQDNWSSIVSASSLELENVVVICESE